MKRSKAVPLIFIGTLTVLAGCGPADQQVNTRQNQYATAKDCESDWGSDARNCTPRSGGGYYGPRYFHTPGGSPMAIDQNGTTRPLTNAYAASSIASSKAIGTTTGTSSVRAPSSVGSSVSSSRGGFGSTGSSFSGGG